MDMMIQVWDGYDLLGSANAHVKFDADNLHGYVDGEVCITMLMSGTMRRCIGLVDGVHTANFPVAPYRVNKGDIVHLSWPDTPAVTNNSREEVG